MIDKQLRLRGMMMKLLFRPSIRSFKQLHKLSQRMRGKSIKGYECDEIQIPSRDNGRTIRVRTYCPISRKGLLPVVLYFHGGGYAINVPESDHHTIEKFLKATDCMVIAPDYRVSLNAPFPAALDDAFDTFNWILRNSEELQVDQNQLFVAGASAGGGLAIALALMSRDLNVGKISHLFPLYPMIDYRIQTESMRDNNAPVWSEKHNKIAWDLYLKGEVTSYASPAIAEDLSSLPPMTTYVGTLDPFRDEIVEFCKRLEESNVKVNLRVFEKAYHGFEIVNPKARVSIEATDFLINSFEDVVKNSSLES